MARHLFGLSPADFAMQKVGVELQLVPGVTGTVWDSAAGGTRLTDLTSLDASPIDSVTADSNAQVGFYGPDTITSLYLDFGFAMRFLMVATDLGADIDALRTGKLSLADLATTNGITDWLNVRSPAYGGGAKGDSTTDDTAAIQAALDSCPAGGVVYLPQGVYRTSAPVTIPPYVTLAGSHGGGEAQSTSSPRPSAIRPLASFSGAAVVAILDQSLGSYATIASEIAIRDLTIDGSALPAGSVHGIQMTGQIQHVTLRDVQVRQVTGQGIDTAFNLSAPPGPQAPFCLHFNRVSVLWAGGTGITLNNSTDSTFIDVYTLGCSSWGWYIAGAGGSTWVACRAEWSGNEGFNLATNSGTQTFIGCSTDRNGRTGFNVAASASTGPIVLVGCRATRDGRSSTTAGYAGLNVAGTTRPVIVSNLTVLTGFDDDGTSGNNSPQYGLSAAGSAFVSVTDGYVNGVSAGWHDGGGNTTLLRGPLVTGTGITSWTWPGTASTTAASATATVTQALVSGDTQPRYTLDASGKVKYGPGGTTAPDTTGWYRSGPGTAQVDAYAILGGSGQSNGAFSAFLANAKALIAGSPGGGFAIKEGTNARMGTAVLNGTTAVTVANTSVTASTRILLTINGPGGTPGTPYVSAVSAGASFQIKSTNAGDTSTVAWVLLEPA